MVRERYNHGTTAPTPAGTEKAQQLLDQCHDMIGESEPNQAAEAARKAIALVPHQSAPYVAMAEAMVAMNRPARAIEA